MSVRRALSLLAAIVLAGCGGGRGKDAAETAAAVQTVAESFHVGDSVYVRSLVVDAERETLWVGTSVGVNAVDLGTREVRSVFTRAEGLANEYVFAMLVDARGYTWFGTNGGGASRYRDGEWQTYFPMHGLADYWVYSFGEQSDGTIWIGTWAGANRLDPKTGKLSTFVDELVNEWVYGIGVDSSGRVWFGTEGGVSMFDGGEWRSWTHKDGLGAPNVAGLPISINTGLGTRSRHDLSVSVDGRPTYNPNYVFCVHVRDDNTVWFGTWGGGVSRFDGEHWSNLTVEDGLIDNIVFSIAEDDEGVLWFGTSRGLSRYDGRSWHSYTRAEGLPGDSVYAVATAPGGDVWAGTKGGVARLAYPRQEGVE